MQRLFCLIALACLSVSPCALELATLEPARSPQAYQRLSEQVRQYDHQAMTAELESSGRTEPLPAPPTSKFGFDPDAPVDFFTTAEGQRIAKIVLSYQTPSGGWSKRTDMSVETRQPGQAYGVESHYIPTFDNGATTTQIWLLAKAHQATDEPAYADAVARAVRLITLAQYPGGGWPQNFPLTGGYHDYITYNDEVMGKLLKVLHAAARRQPPLDFLPEPLVTQARQSFDRGIQAVLDTQVIVDGTPTIWGAQHHPQTLAPLNARKFEPLALATAESAELVEFLMELDEPSTELKQAIVAAHNWFATNRIDDYTWEQTSRGHNELFKKDGAGPIWARFCEIGSNRPVFGDRDGSVHYDVSEISQERRDGYAWFTGKPKEVLKDYPAWSAKHLPRPDNTN
ncbi:pectate lyase [Gilvimarinus algae]|uniref:Pectate lyase n=1 Tax=Gilvimarinus algae TaxID=3058037 RepID=A0ABT8TGN2_9GAMM|nr:pectate lyase [Gilvimarinus sp. SDUM040014]MDO3383160.1 pectate lyase [Gilvimarinus sp. SDUM040014]